MRSLDTPEPYRGIGHYVREYVRSRNRHFARSETIRQQIARAEQRLTLLQENKKKMAPPSWIEKILKPIAEEMLSHLPGYAYEISGPFGLSSSARIRFTRVGVHEAELGLADNTLLIVFRPLDLASSDNVLGLIDYATDTGNYRAGSMGEMNGLNHPSRPIAPSTTVLDLLGWMREQHAALSQKR